MKVKVKYKYGNHYPKEKIIFCPPMDHDTLDECYKDIAENHLPKSPDGEIAEVLSIDFMSFSRQDGQHG